jgi:ABC-type lipoprotein export system ATPase subunit
MTIQGLSIKKLFGQFDYDISLVNQDGVVILTGPNGYGKTTILNIIYNLFVANFRYYQALNFKSITFLFSDKKNIFLTKGKTEVIQQKIIQKLNGESHELLQSKPFANISLELRSNNNLIDKYIYTPEEDKKLLQSQRSSFPFSGIAIDIINRQRQQPYTRFELDQDDLIHQLQKSGFDIIFPNRQNNGQRSQLGETLCSQNIHFIKDQRLMKPITLLGRPGNKPVNPETMLAYTIHEFANDLRNQIAVKQTEAFQVGQQLDNTFPSRILKPQKKLTKDEFDKRIQELAIIYKQFNAYGITLGTFTIPEYNEEKADVLAVYLDDSEQKTDVFSELLEKINLFVKMLENKQLTNKEIKIDGGKGFSITTRDGKNIDLSLLSSGEQQEIIILYELLFKTQPQTLILIDEPETSLHVMWQKSFIKDMLAIAKIKKMTFCLATHSPQIINGRWDLTTDLYTLVNKEANPDYE